MTEYKLVVVGGEYYVGLLSSESIQLFGCVSPCGSSNIHLHIKSMLVQLYALDINK